MDCATIRFLIVAVILSHCTFFWLCEGSIHIKEFTMSVKETPSATNGTVYDLMDENPPTIKRNSAVTLTCSASSETVGYIIVSLKDKYNTTKAKINATIIQAVHKIFNIDCHQSGTYGCFAGNKMETTKTITRDIIVNCNGNENIIKMAIDQEHVTLRKGTENLTLQCSEKENISSLTLLKQRNAGSHLNYTEDSKIISYTFSKVECDDIGTYVCIANRSGELNRKIERYFHLSVNNCPPMIYKCNESDTEDVKISDSGNTLSVIFCMILSNKNRILAINYHGHWTQNNSCSNVTCLEYRRDGLSQFLYTINVTFKSRPSPKYGHLVFTVGSGYNFRTNNVNLTLDFNDTHGNEANPTTVPLSSSNSNNTTDSLLSPTRDRTPLILYVSLSIICIISLIPISFYLRYSYKAFISQRRHGLKDKSFKFDRIQTRRPRRYRSEKSIAYITVEPNQIQGNPGERNNNPNVFGRIQYTDIDFDKTRQFKIKSSQV
ncbi:unnamed protein product [Lymnaea stagnalis]|uniref:Immunoglobulin domain-containing protein n=1 Tax=Lymnaea stagnalis TaxID=6523 RepID=A0AAV2HTH1_LYMST